MKMRMVVLGVALLTLSSCVTTKEDFQATLSSWFGSSEGELVDAWGPPTNFYERDGKRYLTWASSSQALIGGTPSTTTYDYFGNAYTSPGTAPILVNSNCEILMIVEDDVFSEWRYEGNNCY